MDGTNDSTNSEFAPFGVYLARNLRKWKLCYSGNVGGVLATTYKLGVVLFEEKTKKKAFFNILIKRRRIFFEWFHNDNEKS